MAEATTATAAQAVMAAAAPKSNVCKHNVLVSIAIIVADVDTLRTSTRLVVVVDTGDVNYDTTAERK